MKKLPIYICLFLVVLSLCVPVSAAGLLTGLSSLSLSAPSYPELHISGLPLEAQGRPFALITNYSDFDAIDEIYVTYDALFIYAPVGRSLGFSASSGGDPAMLRAVGCVVLVYDDGTWRAPDFTHISWALDYDPAVTRAVFSSDLTPPDSVVYSYGTLYPVESDGVLSIFGSVGGFLPRVISSLVPIFYNDGLTAIGVLAIAALGISLIFLFFFLISKWLHFGG